MIEVRELIMGLGLEVILCSAFLCLNSNFIDLNQLKQKKKDCRCKNIKKVGVLIKKELRLKKKRENVETKKTRTC